MFSHRFFMHQPMFDASVEQTRNPPEAAPRFVAFARFAHDLLGWFANQPSMTSVKLTCVALPELEKLPAGVRIRHHFTLTAATGVVPSAEDYAMSHLPWAQIGEGMFQLTRQDEAIQQFLKLPDDAALEYQSLVYAVALRIDAAFSMFQVVHDVGLRSAD